ncbi:MAG TPA: chitobiase/beta-hexosaminidase C-terminal domain-containing protein [Draconibacterium sp.]|nr:chitobiase/beta-hexosaminidase C-terminal domain-containing protein [Draconibacterium sp.]
MSEKKIFQILDFCLWILNPLLIVLATFSHKIQPGLFLQWTGKFHPLVLHFPIVFGIVISVWLFFWQHTKIHIDTQKLLLAVNALFVSITAVFGILLSLQNSYEADIINLHKWGGVAVAILSWMFLYILNLKVVVKRILAVLFLIVLIGSTHKGAQLTHGVNALSFPKSAGSESSVEISADSSATVYQLGVAPILAQKCIGCHGEDKTKGGLQLNTPKNISMGGESGDLFDDGILLKTIYLPMEHESHMPPEGKLQLTDEEKNIIRLWVKSGANFELLLNELPKNDSLFLLVNKYQAAASQKASLNFNLPGLEEFNSNYCSVNYLFNGSDEVEVNFFQGANYNRENLKRLEKIKTGIVNLNMQGMPLTKEDIDIILQFSNLQKVNLNSTGLDIGSLEKLKTLTKLKSVSISGIDFDKTEFDKFLDGAKFASVNVWSQKAGKKQLEKVIAKYPDINIIVGDNMEDEVMKISNPTIAQDSTVFSDRLIVKVKHLLKGTVIKYTTDGSEPDSLKSSEYTNPILLTENTVLKIKAFKPGWIGSEVVQRTFYKSGIQPDTIYLVTDPHPKYQNDGAKTLVNFQLGGSNTSNGEWLAYQDYNMEFIVGFNKAKPLKSAYLNAFVDIGAYIFPAKSIKVEGSNDGKQFENIAEAKFPEADKSEQRGARAFSCEFPQGTSFKYYKFTVANWNKLPQWHPGKGKPAWIFVDELFLN